MEEKRMPGEYSPPGQPEFRSQIPVEPPDYQGQIPVGKPEFRARRSAQRIAAAHAKRQRRGRIAIAVTLSVVFILGIILGSLIGGRSVSAAESEAHTPIGEIPNYEPDSLPAAPNIVYYNVPLSHSLQEYIYEVCLDEQVPMSLIIAMIDRESQFTPDIASDTGDMGLMQINTINYGYLEEQYHCADMLNPYQNVFCGIKIVGSYLQKYRNYSKALMAYNMGEYGAQKAWDEGYSSTSYSTEIIALAEQYEDEVGLSANGLGLGLYSA